MADDAKLLHTLTRLVLKHEKQFSLLETLALVGLDHARLIERQLERCMGCPAAATVRYRLTGLRCCDNCASRFAVSGGQIEVPTLGFALNFSHMLPTNRAADQWIDLDFADAVRRLQDIIEAARHAEHFEPDPPNPRDLQ